MITEEDAVDRIETRAYIRVVIGRSVMTFALVFSAIYYPLSNDSFGAIAAVEKSDL